jgi:hypothetical protein
MQALGARTSLPRGKPLLKLLSILALIERTRWSGRYWGHSTRTAECCGTSAAGSNRVGRRDRVCGAAPHEEVSRERLQVHARRRYHFRAGISPAQQASHHMSFGARREGSPFFDCTPRHASVWTRTLELHCTIHHTSVASRCWFMPNDVSSELPLAPAQLVALTKRTAISRAVGATRTLRVTKVTGVSAPRGPLVCSRTLTGAGQQWPEHTTPMSSGRRDAGGPDAQVLPRFGDRAALWAGSRAISRAALLFVSDDSDDSRSDSALTIGAARTGTSKGLPMSAQQLHTWPPCRAWQPRLVRQARLAHQARRPCFGRRDGLR